MSAPSIESLWESWRRPLLSYIYRMVTQHDDAEDLLQETFVRAIEKRASFRGDSRVETWLFGIATHVCLDHLRSRKRWRVDAQLIGEQETIADPEKIAEVSTIMTDPEFVFEIREHVAFCFSCIARTLDPTAQAALMLREVLGFSNEESAAILDLSEPVFRHTLAAARGEMIRSYEGLCQLINKTGVCYQCKGLREFAPESNRGRDLVRIEVAPGVAVSGESLFDARVAIARDADLTDGRSRVLHRKFYADLTKREVLEREVLEREEKRGNDPVI